MVLILFIIVLVLMVINCILAFNINVLLGLLTVAANVGVILVVPTPIALVISIAGMVVLSKMAS